MKTLFLFDLILAK